MDKNERVQFFLRMSEDARFNEEELHKKYPRAIFIENKDTDTQGFILPSDEFIIVSFRGTQEKIDWLTDFNGFHQVIPYGNYKSDVMVHRGFIKAYRSIRGTILQYIATHPDKKQVYVCGHSLGGALATLCAVDVQYNYPSKEVFCYPSGNPKVGNKAFVRSYNTRVPDTIRTYMRTDLVPTLPPVWIERALKQRSCHAGKKNPIGPKKVFIGIINWIKRRFKSKRLAADLTNHSMVLYKKYA